MSKQTSCHRSEQRATRSMICCMTFRLGSLELAGATSVKYNESGSWRERSSHSLRREAFDIRYGLLTSTRMVRQSRGIDHATSLHVRQIDPSNNGVSELRASKSFSGNAAIDISERMSSGSWIKGENRVLICCFNDLRCSRCLLN